MHASLLLMIGCALPAAAAGGAVYYVDCAAGDDTAAGLSPSAAWRSVAKVSMQTFTPGDSILFRRGTACSGMLAPKGSGAAGKPIRLGAWGTGPLPKILAAPGDQAALKLFNQQYWTVEQLELTGGNPHGVFVSGAEGTLRGIQLKDLVVHDVTGTPKNKEGGLVVVAPGSAGQRFEDVLIDGVTAYRTSQWAGILAGGVAYGFLPEPARSARVVVRNSTVHDVQGDGIVLFQVNHGLIENSVAWHTGMQETETIGTPNGIWTWMCRDCAVRRNEAFLTDSPGVDGGAFDIDYGDQDDVVEENYAHDTQGYCASIFGAGGITTNAVVRNNVCAGNGRSPRLARRQGAIYLSTWDHGKLSGVRIHGNRIFWDPPIEAAALVSNAEFSGAGIFEENTVRSSSPLIASSGAGLALNRNEYDYTGSGATRWQYNGNSYPSFEAYRRGAGQDAQSREVRTRPQPARHAEAELPPLRFRDADGGPIAAEAFRGRWLLLAFAGRAMEDRAARGHVQLAAAAQRQFLSKGLQTVFVVEGEPGSETARNLRYDWNAGNTPVVFANKADRSLVLANPQGRIVWRHDGPALPAELGLALREALGNPDYAQMAEER